MAEPAAPDVDAYFQERLRDNPRFWRRLGGRPALVGKSVLEFGCGHGALSLEIAEAGAAKVLGIDLSPERIDYCRRSVLPRTPPGVVAFECGDIASLDAPDGFDLIVSRDVMEHVYPLDPVFAAMRRLLKPAGLLYLGFSPLYFSPFGDHGELGSRLPWAHVLAGEAKVLAAFNRTNSTGFTTLRDAGFNMLTPRQFREALAKLGFQTLYAAVNVAEAPLKRTAMNVFNLLRCVPWLERFFTVGFYIVLRKPG